MFEALEGVDGFEALEGVDGIDGFEGIDGIDPIGLSGGLGLSTGGLGLVLNFALV